MNRSLKFRLWDSKARQFVEDYNFHIRPTGSIIMDGGGMHAKDCILNQFAGLVDKKGKDAFDGDIYRDDKNNHWILCADNLGFWSELLPERNQWLREFTPPIWKNDCEVIGNVHQNPELLK